MVTTAAVRTSNDRFAKSERHLGLVCVFAGATSGIGRATLESLVGMLESSNFYVLGRNPDRFARHLERLRASAPTNKIVFIETQLSLISSVDAACERIKAAEKKVDRVCLSPGGMPFGGATYTPEGLETCFAVSYYSRLRLVSNLLPLLRQSPSARVLSILNGTKEAEINERDINLDHSWSMVAVIKHTTLLTSLAFDYLSSNDENNISFIHGTPGFVKTDTPRTVYPSKKDGLFWWALLSVLQIVSGWVIHLFGMPAKESGERHAFMLTDEAYGTPGSWKTNRLSEVVPGNEVLRRYREDGWMERIWEFTNRVWDKALETGVHQ